MLEAVLSKCIQHYLKEYLKPLEPGQMDLKIFQGMLQLYNLQLSPTALISNHIPFLIRKGSVKYLKAIFPWKNLKNSACEVLIEDMFLVLQFESEIILKRDIQADQKSLHIKGENNNNTPSKDDQSKTIQGLVESIIDNLRVLIKNIHVRIEFPCEPLPIIIGLSTPEISINTVDENDVIQAGIVHPQFIRKQLLIKDFSIYFDTNKSPIEILDNSEYKNSSESVQSFSESMRSIMQEEHQYLFNPTTFKIIMIHTKDKKQPITNKIEVSIDAILVNLDFLQCRSIMQLNKIWSQFMKRRKYVSCMRPLSFNMPFETWQYASKCAILKTRPYVFKPYLALTILKNRLKYIELFKLAKVSKLSASLLGSPKQKLESLEKKVGKTASIYLRELAEAIYVKEESLKDKSEMTAFDLSELKSIFESTELVFSMHQFAASAKINSFSLELLYFKGSPLISLNCQNLVGKLASLSDAVNMNLSVRDANIVSYINEVSRNIFQTVHLPSFDRKSEQKVEIVDDTKIQSISSKSVLLNGFEDDDESNFVFIKFKIPTTGDVSSVDCTIAPIKVTLDTETMNNILEFFTVSNKKKVDPEESKVKTVRLDIGEQLQGFRILRNYKVSIKMDQMSYDFPFKYDDSNVKYLTFEMGNLTFKKELEQLLPKNSQEIPMDFYATLNLNVKVDTFTLLTSEDISANANLVLVNGRFGVNIFAKINLPTLQIFIAEQSYRVISLAVRNLLAIPFMHSDVIANSTQQVFMAGRSKMGCEIKLKALNIFLKDNNIENDMMLTIGDMDASVNYYVSSFQCTIILKNLRITQYKQTFVEILDKIDFRMDKRSDYDPLLIDALVAKPHAYMNFKTINWILTFSNQIIDFIPKKIEPIETPDLKVKVTNDTEPLNIIITDSILTQSIDAFISKAGNYEEFIPQSRLRTDSNNSDSSTDDIIDSEIFTIKKPSSSTRLNLNVSDVLLEMFDQEKDEMNSLFRIENVSISDPSESGFILFLKKFSISRCERYVLKPVDIEVPVYLPNPINVSIDFAESELFSGDINALNVYSPEIFKLMFGGPKPLIKNTIEVNAFCKSGNGYLMEENRDIIASATVSDVSLYIKITSDTLTVNVKVQKCEGFYQEDNFQFLKMENEYMCNYIGTMKDQDITVYVPSAEISLRNSIIQWIIGFIPPPPDESTLQPLKLKLDVEPGSINFLSKRNQISSDKLKLFDLNEEKLEQNGEYIYLFTILIYKTNCVALRDNGLKMDLNVDGIHIKSSFFSRPIFAMNQVNYTMNERLIKAKIPSIDINLPIELLYLLANEISSFIPQDLPSSNSDSLSLLTLGIDFALEKLSISFYPTVKEALRLEIPGITFIHNSSFHITGIEIKSILLYTVYNADDPVLIVNLSKIQSILTFSEKSSLDLSKITFNSISNLPQKEIEKRPLTCIKFTYQMDLIQINYTHFFAKLLIDSILKSMINFQSIPMPQSIKLDKLMDIDIIVDCIVKKIEINFVIIDPIVSIICTGIKINYNDKCEASIKDLSVLSCTENRIVKRSLITRRNPDENLLSITIQKGELYAILAECDFYVDLTLLLYLAEFLLASPFLKMKPLIQELNKPKKKMNYVSFSKALPFSLILKMNKVDIAVPISLENENNYELQVQITSLINVNSSTLSFNMSSLMLNFYDVNAKTAFPPILTDFAVHFSVEIEEDSSLFIKANVLDIYSVFSAADIILFAQFGNSITKAMNSLIFTFEESKLSIFQIRFSKIEIISSSITLVLCKDTHSCSQIVPIFRFVIPPILFKVQKTNSQQMSESPVEIDIQPYLEYFNELTGNFDLIIEPFNLQFCAKITEEKMTFAANILSNVNINLPLTAILKMRDLVFEINESLKNQKTMPYSQLPSMWLCNKLGSFITFVVGKDQISLGHNAIVPLFGVSLTTKISFQINNKTYSIVPNSFNYPTYLGMSTLVVKEPYKGGIMISFERNFQIENNLSFEIKMFSYDSDSKKYTLVSSIEPHKRQPLVFQKEIHAIFTRQHPSSKCTNLPVKLSLLDKSTATFPIMYDNNKSIQCIKTVYNDTQKAARIVSISSQYLLYNLLPSTLYFKSDNNVITSVKRGETTDFYYLENDNFTGFFSMSSKVFLKKKSVVKIDYKNTKTINIFNPEVNQREKCMISFMFEKEISQTTITLYMPVVLYNMSMYVLDFEDVLSKIGGGKSQNANVISSKNNIDKENNNFSDSLELLPNSHRFWCPPTISNHISDDSCLISTFARGNSKVKSEHFDCLATGHNTLFLPSLNDKDLFVPLRYHISNHNRTSVLTFSPLITLINYLEFDIILTPIRDLPNEINGEMTMSGGLASFCDKFGSPLMFPAHSQITVPYIPKNGTFAISIESFFTTPSLSLLEPQRTVFRVQNQKNFILIELQVIDVGTSITAEFKNITFPTPILINNQLDTTVMAFQLVCLTPFEIMPNSTSIFAFDEPFLYPSINILFGERNMYRISLVEDTEKVEMRVRYKNKPVYIQVKHNKNGNKLVIISQEADEVVDKYRFVFESSIYGVAASLIDLQTREIALVYLSNIGLKFTIDGEYLAVSAKMHSIQVDDQNPLAPHPTIVYGYSTESEPNLSIDCLCPIDRAAFTLFDYCAISIQRIDIDADRSFVSDWVNLVSSLDLNVIQSIKPEMPLIEIKQEEDGAKFRASNDGLITFRWFEITPACIVLSYRRKTSRPPMIGNVPSLLKFIPSINGGKVLLPGIIIARLTDRLSSIASKLIGDYKTAAFMEVLRMLGNAGRILKGLGIASAIASSLDISMTSDMTSEIAPTSITKNSKSAELMGFALNEKETDSDVSSSLTNLNEFDNRIENEDELSSCFSYEALSSLMAMINKNSLQPSSLIRFIVQKFSMIKDDDLLLFRTNLAERNNLSFGQKRKMIKKKLIALQEAKNNAIQQAGLKMKQIPGFGYGRGIAGVLTKKLDDPLKNLASMPQSNRVRETRPFAGAKITSFNPAVALAQNIIFKNGGLTEKVKEMCVSKSEKNKKYYLFTENTIYAFNEKLNAILETVKIKNIKNAVYNKEKGIYELKMENGKIVSLDIDSQICINFLYSLLRMHHQFDESLLL